MKDKILDTPFKDTFEDFLEKDESITWKGKPAQYRPFSRGYWLIGIGLCTYISFYLTNQGIGVGGKKSFIPTIIIAIVGIILHIILTFLKNRKKKTTSYAFSQNRIFFRFKKEIFHIFFRDIQSIQIMESSLHGNNKVIYIFVKKPAAIPFTTFNFDFNERRHQPTLELITEADSVAQMIEEGIKNSKAI